MILAIICGLLAGVIGFAPLLIGLKLTKKVTATSNFGYMSILMICLVISFMLMFAFAMLCVNFARDLALPFVLSEAIALSLFAIALGIKRLVKKDKEG